MKRKGSTSKSIKQEVEDHKSSETADKSRVKELKEKAAPSRGRARCSTNKDKRKADVAVLREVKNEPAEETAPDPESQSTTDAVPEKKRRIVKKKAIKTDGDSAVAVKGELDRGDIPEVKIAKDNPEVKPEVKARKRVIATGESEVQRQSRLTIGAKVLAAAASSKKCLGSHVSAAGSVEQAIYNAGAEGNRCMALFVRNQRQWNAKPMDEDTVDRWNRAIKETGFPLSQILPHGSYLMNPGSPDPEKLEKSRTAMLDECKRCERLGIQLYNFHPGSTTGDCTVEECLKTVAATIDYIVDNTDFIVMVVETMAGQGNTVGSTFEQIRDIISMVKNKDRVGVCIDTCHIFAAGYDIRTQAAYDKTMQEFDDVVGLKYLKAFHLNDSKGGLGCRADRHENIGRGRIGKAGFKCIMDDKRLDGIPLVLETPEGDYPREMITLYSL